MTLKPDTSFLVNPDQKLVKKELIIFSILAALISWPLILFVTYKMTPDFPTGNRKAVEDLFGSIPILYGTGPLISAIIVTVVYRRSAGVKALLRKVVEWRVSFRWYLLALTLPVFPQWIALVVWGMLSNTDVDFPEFTSFLVSWIQIAFISAMYYVTEETGWRGFMLPRFLSIHGWVWASLVTGVIWTVWHYPLWIASSLATTGSATETTLVIVASSLFTIGLSVFITWIHVNAKGSVLLAMLFHGSSQANLTKMYIAAGDASLSGSGFIMTEALVLLLTVFLFLLFIKPGHKNRALVDPV